MKPVPSRLGSNSSSGQKEESGRPSGSPRRHQAPKEDALNPFLSSDKYERPRSPPNPFEEPEGYNPFEEDEGDSDESNPFYN